MFIKVIEDGCPICGGEVRGNTKQLYFCKNCNLLFRSFQLKRKYTVKEVITDNKKILKKYKNDEKYKEKEVPKPPHIKEYQDSESSSQESDLASTDE